jgi:hypothetical protein
LLLLASRHVAKDHSLEGGKKPKKERRKDKKATPFVKKGLAAMPLFVMFLEERSKNDAQA